MYPEITKKINCFPAVTLRSGQAWEMQLVKVGKVERVVIVAMRPDETVHSLREI
jgi:hypothetical protein